jgi:branched-chain amino acid transport system ATP-binding protein
MPRSSAPTSATELSSDVLDVRDLHVAYGPVHAVRGVSLSVAAGEVVAVLGPNGAGKSSLLQAVHGLVRAQSGAVRWDGVEITGWRPENVARAGVAFVPERRGIFETLSIADNLRVAGCALRPDDLERQMAAVLNQFPWLEARAAERAAVLSGGERQQLAIARALVAGPDLLMLDEPSLGLAPVVLDTLYERLAMLQRDGLAILLVEQNVARAVKLADRVYALRGGEIELVDDPAELLSNDALRRRHLGFV